MLHAGMETLQVILATFFGLLIGFERQRHGSPAGIRTCGLVCLGACLFGLASTHAHGAAFYHSVVDPTRVAAQIVSGVGFLGGGVIFKDSDRTRGITTAATIWLVASIGLAVAFELYLLGTLGTVLSLILLSLNRWKFFRKHFPKDADHQG
jgi:putative Mg2+ transporter-C (MgtC) family protein